MNTGVYRKYAWACLCVDLSMVPFSLTVTETFSPVILQPRQQGALLVHMCTLASTYKYTACVLLLCRNKLLLFSYTPICGDTMNIETNIKVTST